MFGCLNWENLFQNKSSSVRKIITEKIWLTSIFSNNIGITIEYPIFFYSESTIKNATQPWW